METLKNKDQGGKKNHALRKLIGSVAVAGAVYAVDKLVEKRAKKPVRNK